MASREFTDSGGTTWRVWDVSPTHLHPVTRGEEYMEPWAGGWLTFESAGEKRRLVAPYPSRWYQYDLDQLQLLLEAAEPVGTKRITTPAAQRLISAEDQAGVRERSKTERTFLSPRGRLWTVRLHECLGVHGTETVLRFTAGDSVVDLKEWPSNWKQLEREQYALLLLDAEPPRRLKEGNGPQRRQGDRPED